MAQKVYSAEVASALTAALQQMASTPRRFALRELVTERHAEIEQALALGHSRDSIVDVFRSMGMQATWGTIAGYLRELRVAPQVESAQSDAFAVVGDNSAATELSTESVHVADAQPEFAVRAESQALRLTAVDEVAVTRPNSVSAAVAAKHLFQGATLPRSAGFLHSDRY